MKAIYVVDLISVWLLIQVNRNQFKYAILSNVPSIFSVSCREYKKRDNWRKSQKSDYSSIRTKIKGESFSEMQIHFLTTFHPNMVIAFLMEHTFSLIT